MYIDYIRLLIKLYKYYRLQSSDHNTLSNIATLTIKHFGAYSGKNYVAEACGRFLIPAIPSAACILPVLLCRRQTTERINLSSLTVYVVRRLC